MKPITPILFVAAFSFGACTTTTTTNADGSSVTTRRPDAKTMIALRGAVETIGAAAAQQAIHEIAEQQNAR